ncbi:MAG: deoxyguanosinetriphosphate triphosphohydrolase [Kiritimatiellae bacterium]|nr:deoxyguanosinetriphosphate triphosphohydrolase [Kiritimatiellia bacterium]
MEWNRLLSTECIGIEGQERPYADHRHPFEHDGDIITFSNAFRRLGRKTQVHPFATSAHTHTRLTHSLEVASVGRSLGNHLGEVLKDELPCSIQPWNIGSLVRAACLAHDIGNPPFGHAGEDAMSEWVKSDGSCHLKGLTPDEADDIKAFEGNAQGLRALTQIENYVFRGGLRLTFATLGTFMKYPWTSAARKDTDEGKFGTYLSERCILSTVAMKLGMRNQGTDRWCRHPLAYLAEAADDICYATIDLEDAVELGILKFDEVKETMFDVLTPETRKRVAAILDKPQYHRINFARMREPVYSALIQAQIDGFMTNKSAIMQGSFGTPKTGLLEGSSPSFKLIDKAKKWAKADIYSNRFKREVEMGCYAALGCILNAFAGATIESANRLTSGDKPRGLSRLVLTHMGNHAPSDDNAPVGGWSAYNCLRRTMDYVGGMTDGFAWEMAAKLQGITPGRLDR